MLERRTCSECGEKVGSADIRDGLAREVDQKLYCRKCLLDLGLLTRRAGETEEFIDGVRGILGNVELTPKENLMTERKTRKQVAVALEKVLTTIKSHPSWDREDIINYLKDQL